MNEPIDAIANETLNEEEDNSNEAIEETDEQKFLKSKFLEEVRKLQKDDKIEPRAISEENLQWLINLLKAKDNKNKK
jgi:hypothetical protein